MRPAPPDVILSEAKEAKPPYGSFASLRMTVWVLRP